MSSPISATSNAHVQQTAPVAPPKVQPATVPASSAKEDSVHLSSQAQAAAAGDVDHDGDSH